MTYLNKVTPLRMIEVTLSSGQTASQGDYVLFDTIRATGSHSVTVNSSTGEIGLGPNKRYHIVASIDVDRSSTTSSWEFKWHDASGNVLGPSDGAFEAKWIYSSVANATFTAVYQSGMPVSGIKLRATTLNANSTINTSTRILIMET